MEYTKGEWTVQTYGGNISIEADRNGRKCWIAQNLYDEENEPTLKELQANANLIKSAPDMYEELERAREWLRKFIMKFYGVAGNFNSSDYTEAKKLYQELDNFQKTLGAVALAKAEGK